MSKGLRALERIKDFMKENAKHWKQDVGYVEKELKALEIIKKKNVRIYLLQCADSLRFYNEEISDAFKEWLLTQEEYNLLREELL